MSQILFFILHYDLSSFEHFHFESSNTMVDTLKSNKTTIFSLYVNETEIHITTTYKFVKDINGWLY